MSVRAYLLLDTISGLSEEVVRALRKKPGVVIADSVEGSPDVIVMVEAPDRQRLAELVMPAIAEIENVTDDLRLLVTRDNVLVQTIAA